MDILRVLIVDDHTMVRQSLAMLLNGLPEVEVVAQAATGAEAIEVVRCEQPDVVLMDYTMPDLDGAEATRRIVAQSPNVKVVGLSMHHANDIAEVMIGAGAVAYFSKTSGTGELARFLDELRMA